MTPQTPELPLIDILNLIDLKKSTEYELPQKEQLQHLMNVSTAILFPYESNTEKHTLKQIEATLKNDNIRCTIYPLKKLYPWNIKQFEEYLNIHKINVIHSTKIPQWAATWLNRHKTSPITILNMAPNPYINSNELISLIQNNQQG